jgi:hypothetical protein
MFEATECGGALNSIQQSATLSINGATFFIFSISFTMSPTFFILTNTCTEIFIYTIQGPVLQNYKMIGVKPSVTHWQIFLTVTLSADLVSISPTFYEQLLRQNPFAKKLQTQIVCT